MKTILFVAVFLLSIGHVALAQSEQSEKKSEEKEAVQKAQPSEEADGDAPAPKEQEWPPPFTPSEKVGADSVISFPTDI